MGESCISDEEMEEERFALFQTKFSFTDKLGYLKDSNAAAHSVTAPA